MSDTEVEEVVRHLRAQGMPSYIESVTNDPDGEEGGLGLPGEGEEAESDQLHDQAIASGDHLNDRLRSPEFF